MNSTICGVQHSIFKIGVYESSRNYYTMTNIVDIHFHQLQKQLTQYLPNALVYVTHVCGSRMWENELVSFNTQECPNGITIRGCLLPAKIFPVKTLFLVCSLFVRKSENTKPVTTFPLISQPIHLGSSNQ